MYPDYWDSCENIVGFAGCDEEEIRAKSVEGMTKLAVQHAQTAHREHYSGGKVTTQQWEAIYQNIESLYPDMPKWDKDLRS